MSTEPKMTHIREVGRTTDPNRFTVKVERTVWLDPLLTEITGRSAGRIHLVARDGYNDAQAWHIAPDQASLLIAALENAVDDIRDAERWDNERLTTPTPAAPSRRAEVNGAGE